MDVSIRTCVCAFEYIESERRRRKQAIAKVRMCAAIQVGLRLAKRRLQKCRRVEASVSFLRESLASLTLVRLRIRIRNETIALYYILLYVSAAIMQYCTHIHTLNRSNRTECKQSVFEANSVQLTSVQHHCAKSMLRSPARQNTWFMTSTLYIATCTRMLRLLKTSTVCVLCWNDLLYSSVWMTSESMLIITIY